MQISGGIVRPGYPSLGAWVNYGLGSLNQNLPAYVVMHDTKPRGDDGIWSPGYLPKDYQPLLLDSRRKEEIANLSRPQGISDQQQRAQLDLLQKLNQEHQQQHPLEGDLSARIQTFEMAYRMQSAAPEALDLRQEPTKITSRYGLDRKETATFGRQCL